MIAAFQEIQARTGTQKLWIGPNEHYFVYAENFWPRDPYFEWFGYWLKDQPTALIDEPPVFYSPRAWVEDRAGYRPDDWRQAERWPPPGVHAAAALSARRREPRRRAGRAAARLCLRPAPADADAGRPQHADRGRPARPAAGAGAARLRAHLRGAPLPAI